MVATGDVIQPDIEVAPAVFRYQFGSNSTVKVRLSNVTTRTVVVPSRALLCEIQEVTLEDMPSDSNGDNNWFLQKITLPTEGLTEKQLQLGTNLILEYQDIRKEGHFLCIDILNTFKLWFYI